MNEYNTGLIEIPQDSLKNGSTNSTTFQYVIGSSANGNSLGSALRFSGLQNVLVSENSDLNFNEGSPFTVSVWVNVSSDNYLMQINNGRHGVMSKGSFNTCNYAIGIQSGTEPRFEFGFRSGVTIYSTISPNLSLDSWHHLAGTYDGSRLLQFYINNSFVGSFNTNGSPFNGGLGSILFGRSSILGGGGPGSEVIQYIDEGRIYSKTLSTGEIGSLYEGRNVTDRLVGYWNFNEGTGSIAFDSSDGNFEFYTPSINGTIESISFDNLDNFETGSLYVLVSGTNEQIMFETSGLAQNFTVFPFAYGNTNQAGTSSPWGKVKRVVNGPLLIIGSDIGEATDINNIKVVYK